MSLLLNGFICTALFQSTPHTEKTLAQLINITDTDAPALMTSILLLRKNKEENITILLQFLVKKMQNYYSWLRLDKVVGISLLPRFYGPQCTW